MNSSTDAQPLTTRMVFKIVAAIIIVLISFGATLYFLDRLSGISSSTSEVDTADATASPGRASPVTEASDVAILPKVPLAGFRWLAIVGLYAQVVAGEPAVPYQSIVRLIAIPTDGVHTVAAQLDGLEKGHTYRIAAWVKSETGGNLLIEASDHATTAANYGTAIFALARQVILSASGAAKPGSELDSNGWQKVWIDIPNTTGQLFFNLYVSQGQMNRFMGDGNRGFTLGGLAANLQE